MLIVFSVENILASDIHISSLLRSADKLLRPYVGMCRASKADSTDVSDCWLKGDSFVSHINVNDTDNANTDNEKCAVQKILVVVVVVVVIEIIIIIIISRLYVVFQKKNAQSLAHVKFWIIRLKVEIFVPNCSAKITV